MKVIFLDFDGVINSWAEAEWHRQRRETKFWPWLRYTLIYGLAVWLNDRLLKGTNTYYRTNLWVLSHFSDHEIFCPIACANLKYILKHNPDAKIVISSGWACYGMKCIKRVFRKNELPFEKVIALTPQYYGHEEEEIVGSRDEFPHDGGIGRAYQIQAWLNENPKVKDYVILDDLNGFGKLRPRHVHTDEYTGLTLRDAERANQILKASYSPTSERKIP